MTKKSEMERGRRVHRIALRIDEDELMMLGELRDAINSQKIPGTEPIKISETIRAAIRIASAQIKG